MFKNLLLSIICFLVAVVAVTLASVYDNDPELCKQRVVREDCPTVPAPFDNVNSNDVIEVYYLQAPIFEGLYGDFGGKLGGYHSALGFYDLTTGINYTAEYDAYYEVANGTFPNIMNINGTDEVVWCNAGILCAFPWINATYWDSKHFSTASRTYMTTINGSVFNQFIPWSISYNNSNPIYQTWDVWNSYGQDLYVPSNTCDDFAVAAFNFLYSRGSTYDCNIVLKRDYINLFSEKPVPVDYEENKDEIIRFYQAFNVQKGESFLTILENLLSIVGLPKFIYIQEQYLQLSLNFPFADLKYDFAPLPGCPAPSTIDTEKVIHMPIRR
ncbi:hypothetical protein DFA_06195 [Cavenderia fasciculata]|uniref:Uncharacterized protein n=1 Tax=Cavenderia fasciculata TaxID=261658 RepID=F4PKD3_CACFS|nr:uncharacterized protein DFA_06195 [Cavenderia fasciculata]EGG24057.1 hypothetical protein DFA_06195 [Cavenderia fasciculata]|eukprot:XP_004361908.1 hypothetical protein DFA_06195 [Cavenderia fasciculata]